MWHGTSVSLPSNTNATYLLTLKIVALGKLSSGLPMLLCCSMAYRANSQKENYMQGVKQLVLIKPNPKQKFFFLPLQHVAKAKYLFSSRVNKSLELTWTPFFDWLIDWLIDWIEWFSNGALLQSKSLLMNVCFAISTSERKPHNINSWSAFPYTNQSCEIKLCYFAN